MIVNVYRVPSGFCNKSDRLYFDKPFDDDYKLERYDFPDGYTISYDLWYGMPFVYDLSGEPCAVIPLGTKGIKIIVSETKDIVLKPIEVERQAAFIQDVRNERRLTLQELSELSGVSLDQLQSLENGDVKVEDLPAKTFMALANALDVSPNSLI